MLNPGSSAVQTRREYGSNDSFYNRIRGTRLTGSRLRDFVVEDRSEEITRQYRNVEIPGPPAILPSPPAILPGPLPNVRRRDGRAGCARYPGDPRRKRTRFLFFPVVFFLFSRHAYQNRPVLYFKPNRIFHIFPFWQWSRAALVLRSWRRNAN